MKQKTQSQVGFSMDYLSMLEDAQVIDTVDMHLDILYALSTYPVKMQDIMQLPDILIGDEDQEIIINDIHYYFDDDGNLAESLDGNSSRYFTTDRDGLIISIEEFYAFRISGCRFSGENKISIERDNKRRISRITEKRSGINTNDNEDIYEWEYDDHDRIIRHRSSIFFGKYNRQRECKFEYCDDGNVITTCLRSIRK